MDTERDAVRLDLRTGSVSGPYYQLPTGPAAGRTRASPLRTTSDAPEVEASRSAGQRRSGQGHVAGAQDFGGVSQTSASSEGARSAQRASGLLAASNCRICRVFVRRPLGLG